MLQVKTENLCHEHVLRIALCVTNKNTIIGRIMFVANEVNYGSSSGAVSVML